MSPCRHHQDCGDRSLRIAASSANQVVTLASGLETDLGNSRRIVDQLDTYQVEFSFQRFPVNQWLKRRALIQMRTSLRVHRIEQLGNLHDHLPSLPNHELFALQSRQMLRDSRA